MNTTSLKNFLFFCIPALIAAALFLPSLHFNLVWDDSEWVEKVSLFKGTFLEWIPYSFTTNTIGPYYRPVALATFFYPFDSTPPIFLWHAVNYSLYIFDIFLLAVIFFILHKKVHGEIASPNKIPHLLAGIGLLFFVALHPSQVETATWISCRFDLLSNTFLLLILLAEFSNIPRKTLYILQPLLFFLALLSKETAVVFLAIYPVIAHYHSREDAFSIVSSLKDKLPMLSLFSLCTVLYFLIWNHLIGITTMANTEKMYPLYNNTSSHIYLVAGTLGHYISLFFYPFKNLNPYHSLENSIDLLNPYLWLGVSASVLALFAWIKNSRIWPVLAVVFIAISPFLNWFQISYTGSVIQNRYLSLPLLFGSITLFIYLCRTPVPANLIKYSFFFPLYLLFMAMTTHSTLPLWKNNLSVWTWVHHENPTSAYAKNNLASALMGINEDESALQLLEESLALDENFWVYSNISEILWKKGEHDNANQYALKALNGVINDNKIIFILDVVRKNISVHQYGNAQAFLEGVPVAVYQSRQFKTQYDLLMAEINEGRKRER